MLSSESANAGMRIEGMAGIDGILIDGLAIDGIEIEGMAGSDGIEGSVMPDSHVFCFCDRGGAGTINRFVPPKNDLGTGRTGAGGATTGGGGAAGFRTDDDSSLMRRSTSGPSRLSADMMPI